MLGWKREIDNAIEIYIPIIGTYINSNKDVARAKRPTWCDSATAIDVDYKQILVIDSFLTKKDDFEKTYMEIFTI